MFVIQHVPISRNGGFPPDAEPFWTVQGPYPARELLCRLDAKRVFAGHSNSGMVFQSDGITYHLALATSWTPFKVPLGFALHTISANGEVNTEFLKLK